MSSVVAHSIAPADDLNQTKLSFLILKITSIMKKVKLMLLSFSVLAVVAGALAFRAKGTRDMCYAAKNPSPPFCGTILMPKACPNRTTKGSFLSGTPPICTAPTSGNSSSPCTNVNCLFDSVEFTTTE